MKLINHDENGTLECFGGIFPELAKARFNTTNRGKVFSSLIESRGIGIQGEELAVDEKQWKDCTECPQFDGCYKLSMAKLAFETAINERYHG